MGLPGGAAGKESACNVGDLGSIPGFGRSPGGGNSYPPQCSWAFPGGSAGKESACNAGDLGSIPGLGRSPGGGNGYPLPYSGLENPVDFIDPGVAKSWTRLCSFQFSTKTMSSLRTCGCVHQLCFMKHWVKSRHLSSLSSISFLSF